MSSKILARIAEETGVPGLAEILARDLSGSDLQSLLIEVFHERAGAVGPADLLSAYARALLAPSRVDARLFNQFDQIALGVAGAFEALDLSPVAPLGLNHVLGQVDQNNVMTTVRNAEVLGDPTPVLALECARRRKDAKSRGAAVVRLCTSARVVRLQPFDLPGYVPHFRLFALVTAGRDQGSHVFEMEHLREHIRCYLELCRALNQAGFNLASPVVEVSDTAIVQELLTAAGVSPHELRNVIRAHKIGESERFLAEHGVKLPDAIEDPAKQLSGVNSLHRLVRVKADVFDVLAPLFPAASFRFNLTRLEGLNYYRGLCVRISVLAPDDNRYPAADGGFTDWTARLLQDRKERLLATGIGVEFASIF
jgi:hypothetical protein